MLVPYNPPPARCRRSDESRLAAQRSFANFIRTGGRVNPLPIGAGPRDEESAPLMGNSRKDSDAIVSELMKASNRQTRAMYVAISIGLIVTASSLFVLGFLAWRIYQNVDAAEKAIRPHGQQIVNATVEMLNDMGGTWSSMHEISEYTEELAASAGGKAGSAAVAMNSSALIAKRLAEFMQHPTMQISLGG